MARHFLHHGLWLATAVPQALHNEPQPVLPPKEGVLMGFGKTLATVGAGAHGSRGAS